MKNKKQNTDNLIRDILLKAEVDTPANIWGKLEKDLDFADKSRKIIYYRSLAAVAAVVLVCMTAGIIYLVSENRTYKNEIAEQKIIEKPEIKKEKQKNEIVKIEEKQNIALEEKQNIYVKETKLEEKKNKIISSQNAIAIVVEKKEERIKNYLHKISPIYSSKVKYRYEFEIALLPENTNFYKGIIPLNKQDIITFKDELYADNFVPNKKKGKNKWTIGGDFSPSYVSMNKNASKDYAVNNALFYNSDSDAETPMVAYTGGLNVDYRISEKWSLQLGMYYLKQGQEIQDFVVLDNNFAGANKSSSNTSIGNITFNNQNQVFENETVINETNYGFDVLATQFDSYLIQNLEFLEIPFVLKYQLLNKKLGMYLLSGFNASFLIGNNVYLESNSSPIGKTEDVNTLIYKGIIGFVIEYPISKKISINISPVYKYQLNSINKNIFYNAHLQYFDFKTGISYKL